VENPQTGSTRGNKAGVVTFAQPLKGNTTGKTPLIVVSKNGLIRDSSVQTFMVDVAGPVIDFGVVNYIKGVNVGGATSVYDEDMGGRHMLTGISKSTTEGSPSAPSLEIAALAMWRFRWTVAAGARSISVLVKQQENTANRPSMIVRTNSNVGINSDLTAVAPSGTGWVTIGPITFTSTGADVVWVELHNNCMFANYTAPSPAFFDHIVVS
jgi:hypothetical protein